MTRDKWEEVLYANVKDEVEQDRLNQYVLELESENAKLRDENKRLQEENARLRSRISDAEKDEAMARCAAMQAFAVTNYFTEKCKELGIEVD